MLDNGIISVDANRRVHWTGGVQPLDGKEQHPFCEVQRHAENGTLILIDEKLFAWEFSPEVFGASSVPPGTMKPALNLLHM